MNNKQKELAEELKQIASRLGHSPNRREIPDLARKCYKLFGSFNKAKLSADLKTKYTRKNKFPKNAFKKDKDLAAIVSYLTFDGHLYKDLKGFMYSSKNVVDLDNFNEIIKRKFDLPPRYHLFSSGAGETKTHKIYFFNKKVCNELLKVGVPKGAKVIQHFDIPRWIVNSKEFSCEYLKIAFFCEGYFKEEKGRTPRITFTTSKWEDIINSGLLFTNQLKLMLKKFDIETKESYITGMRVRKDKKITRDIRFRIATEDNNKFIREIGWVK